MSTVLDQKVLVLNRLWQAVNICSVRRAMGLIFQGNAQVVFGDDDGSFQTFDFREWTDFSQKRPDDDEIQAVSVKIRVPRVILLMVYDRTPRQDVKFTRHNIFERDKSTCQYCGRTFGRNDLNLDHVIPRDQGGPTSWENIVCSCIPCNTRKANRTPQQARMRLISKPQKPKWRPFIQIGFGYRPHESWHHFINVSYWNVELGEDLS